jgi:acyl-coenzyme A thioesterase PaaI-like protein
VTESGEDYSATLNAQLPQLIPAAHRMGVTFVEMRAGYVRAEVPFEGNGNHFGVMYAGVIFTLAEVLGGALHQCTFERNTHFPLVRRLSIDFLSPGTGRLSASASMNDEELARITAAAQPGAKVAFVLEAEVANEDGTVVARAHGDDQLRPFPTA